jgi:hypothetical protein
MTVSGYDYLLQSSLTVDVPVSGIKYVKVDGRFNAVVMGTKILSSGGQYQVSVALESWLAITSSGYQDSEIVWSDYITPSSPSIATVTSGWIWKQLSPAPNIIKLYNNSTGSQKVRFNLRGCY